MSINYKISAEHIEYYIVTKNWDILQISPSLPKVFDKKPMITYQRNKNLGELIKGHNLQGGKVFKTHL